MSGFVINPRRQAHPTWDPEIDRPFRDDDILAFHSSFSEYRPTPLHVLPELARRLNVGGLVVKDESFRFGLNAFKVLGASYAVYRFLQEAWEESGRSPFAVADWLRGQVLAPGAYTFCTATDGNHGRAVAWIARRLCQAAVIYMPENSAPARVRNIRAEGAEVVIVNGTYDDTVRKAQTDAARNGWQIIADTAYADYLTVPKYIMAGYLTIFREIEKQLHAIDAPPIDQVFVQAGVGSLAAAAAWYYAQERKGKRPALAAVEPQGADCLLASAARGEVTTVVGQEHSIMAGLDCGTPSLLAWPLVRDGIDLFLAISDDYAIEAMRRYYYPLGNDPQIISGESGAAGLAGLLALLSDPGLSEAKRYLGIGPKSWVLLLNTEGATDPDHFAVVVRN